MAKNQYLAKKAAVNRGYFIAGVESGRQQVIDMLCLALRDPEIVKKDTFGKDRLNNVICGIWKYMDLYYKAWEKDEETDYYRAKLDDALARAFGDEMKGSFLKRYEYAVEFDYVKGKWRK